MFQDREDAAYQLVERLRDRKLKKPVVLGVPRGGIVLAAILARELHADLDVLLSRKLRAPHQPELAIGAINEDGQTYFSHPDLADDPYLKHEIDHQISEISRRRALISDISSAPEFKQRSIVVTDDGIATGSTMIAGLMGLQTKQPFELIVAVPVAPPDTLKTIKNYCDEVICLKAPTSFWAIGQFYRDFHQVSDAQMIQILRNFKSDNARQTESSTSPRASP